MKKQVSWWDSTRATFRLDCVVLSAFTELYNNQSSNNDFHLNAAICIVKWVRGNTCLEVSNNTRVNATILSVWYEFARVLIECDIYCLLRMKCYELCPTDITKWGSQQWWKVKSFSIGYPNSIYSRTVLYLMRYSLTWVYEEVEVNTFVRGMSSTMSLTLCRNIDTLVDGCHATLLCWCRVTVSVHSLMNRYTRMLCGNIAQLRWTSRICRCASGIRYSVWNMRTSIKLTDATKLMIQSTRIVWWVEMESNETINEHNE